MAFPNPPPPPCVLGYTRFLALPGRVFPNHCQEGVTRAVMPAEVDGQVETRH